MDQGLLPNPPVLERINSKRTLHYSDPENQISFSGEDAMWSKMDGIMARSAWKPPLIP